MLGLVFLAVQIAQLGFFSKEAKISIKIMALNIKHKTS